jgi:hypothetical protein
MTAPAAPFSLRVGELAAGRAGDKGDVLDLTLVARDDAAYALLERTLTAQFVREALNRVVPGPVQRYCIPGLRALKYVAPQALAGGVYATLRPGLHWQKAAIWLLLDLDVPADGLTPLDVIPAHAGIHPQLAILDPGFRRDDSCSPSWRK